MNIIQSSPVKKKKTEKVLFEKVQRYCAKFMDIEILDLLVVLAQSLSTDVQNTIGTLGVEISHLAKRMKENSTFQTWQDQPRTAIRKTYFLRWRCIVMKSLLKCMSVCYKQ